MRKAAARSHKPNKKGCLSNDSIKPPRKRSTANGLFTISSSMESLAEALLMTGPMTMEDQHKAAILAIKAKKHLDLDSFLHALELVDSMRGFALTYLAIKAPDAHSSYFKEHLAKKVEFETLGGARY